MGYARDFAWSNKVVVPGWPHSGVIPPVVRGGKRRGFADHRHRHDLFPPPGGNQEFSGTPISYPPTG